MIEAIADLFVERVPPATGPRRIGPAARLLVVDATARGERVRDLLAALERSAPVSASVIELGELDALPEIARFDLVWLFVEGGADLAYCSLVRHELKRRFPAAQVAQVGFAASEGCDFALDAVVLSGPPWRRRKAVAKAAAALAGRLASGRGQASIPLVAGIALLMVGVVLFAQFGGALAARGRDQRTADLSAAAAGNRMAKDYPRLFEPALLPNGAPNPHRLSAAAFRARARAAATRVAIVNRDAGRIEQVRFGPSPAPSSVTVVAAHKHEVAVPGGGDTRTVRVRARATAELRFTFAAMPGPSPSSGSGGGYSGPLAYRQGKPMRPDVALAFDRMAAAARGAGLSLSINSAFRSDAEQARLFAQHPDPKWVAPPGTSLHRYGTELDLGPPGAYGWLARNSRRFGFIKRYAWEPWHFGFGANPRDVPAQYGAGSRDVKGGSYVGATGLPSWVPERYRRTIVDAAQQFNVQPLLLAAQLKAESDFNPNAVSSAGAQGIAQFMPGTARSVGLTNPFDPRASIMAQAKLMGLLIKQFGSIPKALAAYNAGPGAVQKYGGIPPFAETQSYVAKIIGLMMGAGAEFDDPAFAGIGFTAQVRIVR